MPAVQGFEEIPHTADLALQVRGQTITALFEYAARGTVWLTRCELLPETQPQEYLVNLEAPDLESLLVVWLNEVLYLVSEHNLYPEAFVIHEMTPVTINASIHGRSPGRMLRALKAATFHGLQVVATSLGYQAVVVFDV